MEVMKLNRPRNDIVKPFSCDIPVEEEMTLDYFQFRVVFCIHFCKMFPFLPKRASNISTLVMNVLRFFIRKLFENSEILISS